MAAMRDPLRSSPGDSSPSSSPSDDEADDEEEPDTDRAPAPLPIELLRRSSPSGTVAAPSRELAEEETAR